MAWGVGMGKRLPPQSDPTGAGKGDAQQEQM